MRKLVKLIGLVLLLVFVDTPVLSLESVKQFEETSYYLKDVCFINSEVGWAVGEPYWDQTEKRYRGTIIKTVDGGESWVPQVTGVSETLRGVCFVDENNGWVVGANGAILHTSDGGNNWIKQTVATINEFLAVVFKDSNNGWATSVVTVHYDVWGHPDDWRGSIWHTSNGGQTWTKQSVPENASILRRIDLIDSNNGWVAGIKFIGYDEFGHPQHVGAVYHTSNGGLTWEEQYSPNLDIVFTGVDFVDSNNGWVVGFKGNWDVQGGTVFHTTDGGITWEQHEPDAILWDVHFLDQNRGYTVGFDYIGAWGPPVFRTLDGGATWEKVKMEKHDMEGLFGVSVIGDRVIAVGDHDYVSISTDPWGTYEWPYGENLFTQKYINVHYKFEDVYFEDDNHGWVVGSRSFEPKLWGQVIFHTQDGGETWETQYEHAPPDTLFSYFRLDSVYFTDSQNGWAVGSSERFSGQHQGAILHTADGGQHWEDQSSELYKSWGLEFFAVQFLDNQNGWALAADRFPYDNIFLAHTIDGGVNWEWVDTGIEGRLSIGFALVQGDLFFTDPQHVWAAGGLGTVIHTGDGGATWIEQELTCGYPSCPIRLFAVEFIDNQVGWIAGEKLYHTTDGGATWIEQDTGVGVDFQDVQFTDSINGWLAGDSGVMMYTNDGGTTWNLIHSGTSFHLLGISFTSPQRGWVVGDYGTIIAISTDVVDVCECDLNSDGSCDMQDWLLFGEDWGRTDCGTPPGSGNPPNDCECDLDNNGRCDMQDWFLFGEDWGRTDCPIP